MKKIASPVELQTELKRILAYAQSERPSRARIALALQELADRTAANEPIPKDLVEKKYHREGWLRNLDEYKADAVLTSGAKQKAQKLLGPKWKGMKPSAILRALGK